MTPAQRDKRNAARREWRKANPDKVADAKKRYYGRHPEGAKRRATMRYERLKKSTEAYRLLREKQRGYLEKWRRSQGIKPRKTAAIPNVTPYGYRMITADGRRIFEHRHVMETVLGRRLLRTEIVHHKNGNKLDNRPENLEVMTRRDHALLHHSHRNLLNN